MMTTPTVYSLKPAFQGLLRPLARTLANLGITANEVTLLACVVSVGYGILLVWQTGSHAVLLLLPVLLFVRMALNALDGMLAREFGQKSAVGAYLNELGDVISDVGLYAPFAFWPEFDLRWMVAAVVLAVISEMAGVVAVMAGASRRYDGPMGKSDRALVFGTLAAWRGVGWGIAPWAALLFAPLLVLLLSVTVVNRVRNGIAEANAGGING